MYYPPPKQLGPGSIVDCYLRDSGGEEQDRSIESQLIEVQAYFAKYKWVSGEIYKDTRTAKSVVGRKAFELMLTDYESGRRKPHGLIIWDYARFARNARDAVLNIAIIENTGIIIHSLTDNIPDGEYKDLVRLVKHMGNQAEREKNSAAVKREMHQLVANTKAMFGTPPRGIKRHPLPPVRNERTGELRTLHQWIPDEEMAPLILRAFEMRAQNKTLAQINEATGLYSSVNGYATFFNNKIYKGILEFGGKTFEAYCEPIVPPELWDLVNNMNPNRKPGSGIRDPRRVQSVYLLSGLTHCQQCGAALTGHRINGWEYYICSRRKLTRGAECNARYIPKRDIEPAVFEAIKDHALDFETLINIQVNVNNELSRTAGDIERERLKLNRELVAQQKKATNITNAIAAHGHSDSLLTALEAVEALRDQTKNKLKQLEEHIDIPRKTKAQLKDIAAAITTTLNGTDEQKRITIRSFVTRILARRDETTLTTLIYYLPLKIINSDERSLLGQALVPPRGLSTEQLITTVTPLTRKARSR